MKKTDNYPADNLNILYKQLIAVYTDENLTKITSWLIDLYKRKKYDYLQNLISKIHFDFDLKKINKVFSKLILTYHPDKLNFYLKNINEYYNKKDIDSLQKLTHIFIFQENTTNQKIYSSYEDYIFPDDINWAYDETDFDNFEDEIDSFVEEQYSEDYDFNIISAIKLKEYGNLNIHISSHHLQEIEGELDLSDMDIDDLSGIEKCENVESLNLSNNKICDITYLSDLYLLEELFLSHNRITEIDNLKELKNLKTIDLSHNQIFDFSVLDNFEKLEFIDISNNKNFNKINVEKLQKKGIVVIY